MHGFLFFELKSFVERQLGSGAWCGVLEGSGFKDRIFLPVTVYPDAELFKLLHTSAARMNRPLPHVLESFGRHLAPRLLEFYGSLIKPEWRTLEVLENTERVVHTVVRLSNPDARPARLSTLRLHPDQIMLTYQSPRQLCSLARGIMRGLASHFHEEVRLVERACMLNGAQDCQFLVTRSPLKG